MGIKHDILAILSDGRIYDTLGIKNNLVVKDEKYSKTSLNHIGDSLRRLERDGDVYIETKPAADRYGNPLPGRKLIECQITQHGLKKVDYLYKTGKIRKKMITALM